MLNNPESAPTPHDEEHKDDALSARDQAEGTGGYPPPNEEEHAVPQGGEQPAPEEAEAPAADPEVGGSVVRPPTVKVVSNFDEVGASQRVLAACQDSLRYLTDRKLLYAWDGTKYGDHGHLAKRWALEALDKVHREFEEGRIHMTEDGQPVDKEDFLKFQGKVRSLGMINKALALASLAPRIQVTSREFDADHYKINLQNGLLDLETLELAPHHPSQQVTKVAPVTWEPDAKCPFWEDSITKMSCGDRDLADYLRRQFGYSMTGSTYEEVMTILHGCGANGKSLFLGTNLRILGSGEYGLTLNPEMILKSTMYGMSYFYRQVEGKRSGFAIETDQDRTLGEGVMKALVSGDELSGRGVAKDPVQFRPRIKIFMGVNHLPALLSTDHAMRRRIRVVPFRHQFDNTVNKEELEGKVERELSGIFAWAVRGFLEWRKQGLNPPKVVLDATAAYFQENDHISRYLEERTDISDPNARTQQGLLYSDYLAWTRDCGSKALGKIQFGKMLTARHFEAKGGNPSRFWQGIAIKRIG
ncbi:hypothetical protein G3N56_16305 [Desulfovibrio sulfodismutans]|uniref:SF3 helicase domain-containing protein n=1 Tax=Desulfolutivibrio sulfodismutans TaxID=63561 RepID=A0A7K3NQ13_9BACT|nr:phage/plasmid primase, P4 family [Desulfolutivibrio sulfodismutans]NDY58296.1 hypothetical protein [Desulfolutivibrio sulfodismutans]